MADGHTSPRGTADAILDVAQRLVQTRGYNAFSYGDIASELKVTKASLHYHFPSKAELGARLIERYDGLFTAELARIDGVAKSAPQKLKLFADIYGRVLADNRMCLCGMLTAEFETLPGDMRERLALFFRHSEAWLTQVLGDGRKQGEIAFEGKPADVAQFLVGSLEGLMMMARSQGGVARFKGSVRRLLAEAGVD